jgi:hypothetical protein
VAIVTQEEKIRNQRSALDLLMPTLQAVKAGDPSAFVVNTYEGVEGFKQMLWHELKTEGEELIFGSGTIDDLVGDARWAERHRDMTTAQGYKIRELLNPGGKNPVFTLNETFMEQHYTYRVLPANTLYLQNQMVIYNDTVGIYHWRHEQKVGMEVINKDYATFMRQVFENYWMLADQQGTV